MRRRKDVSNRSLSLTYQFRRRDDVSAWSATSRPTGDRNETSLRRGMPGGNIVIWTTIFWAVTIVNYVRIMAKYSSVFYLEFRTKFTTSKNYRWDNALREQIPNSLFHWFHNKVSFFAFFTFVTIGRRPIIVKATNSTAILSANMTSTVLQKFS